MDSGARPRAIYADRLAEHNLHLQAFTTRRDRIGYIRLLVFLAAAIVLWYVFHGLSLWSLAAPVAIFVALVWWQSRVERSAECVRRAISFCERGIARLENRWQGTGETGDQFADPHHPYASDLDLFGRASLFELLSTARTRGGEARLAAWLKSSSNGPATLADLQNRHEAINELKPLLDLREQIAVLGADFRTGVNPDQLANWAAEPAKPFPKGKRILALAFSLAAISALLWWLATDGADLRALLTLVAIGAIEGLFAFGMRTQVLNIVAAVDEPAHDLDLLSKVLETLERQQFHSAPLITLSAALAARSGSASRQIARLRRLTDLLDSRDDPLVRALGPLVLWTTQVAMAVEAWHAENGSQVAAWLNAVSEIEALSSLSNYAWEHPDDPFPAFIEDGCPPRFEGEEMRHPLLPDDHSIPNSVCLATPLQLLIVSGSNMSGKSTLLRTVGVNAVLALAGAPVRAKRLTLSRLSPGASIRTTDSLEEGHSRFMAEILRLKQVLELPPPALFLLDELLGGTNSHDRALGSEGLIRALLIRKAIGLVTTHDLSLTRVADELAPQAANVHFEDRLEDGRLVFDYRMRPGVVERSNALDLMRAVGLDV
jgi:MutS domain V